MNFRQAFFDSLLPKSGLTNSIFTNTYLPTFMSVSQLALDKLFYLQAYSTTTCAYPYHYEMDSLDSYLLLYTIEGQGSLTYNNTSYLLSPHTVIFIRCNHKHSIGITQATSWHFKYVFINGNLLNTYYELYSRYNDALCILSELSLVPDIFRKLCKQAPKLNLERDLINSKLITELLTEILLDKFHYTHNNCSIPIHITEIKKDFENNYASFFSLDEIAEKYNRSKFQLTREFSQHVKASPIHYLIVCRINAAKELLWTTDKTITEIGSLVGIDNTNHFINLFRKNTGVTPLKYRKLRP